MKKLYFLSLFLTLFLPTIGQNQLTNLPTFYINTSDGKPIVDKENYVKANITIVSNEASESFSDSVKIRGRGNSTWTMPKKPYKLKFYKKKRLLNESAKAKSWVLLSNHADKTLMRNGLAFQISKLVGLEFTPSARFVDVVLNGEYLGNYMMSDQVQVKKGRVEIEEQEPDDITEPNITGGYLLELDGFAYSEPVFFKTKKGMSITIKYPKHDEINIEQRNYITNYTKQFENILFSSNFQDQESGYRAYIDTTTLINWYIACELTGNSDSFWSTYIYKKRNDPKFYFGPMWDYDIAFNNDYRLGDATRKLMREYAHEPKTWIKRFWEDPWFQKAVNKRWKELVNNGIEQQLIDYITKTAVLLNESQQINYSKWQTLETVVYREQFLFSTYEEGVEYLKSYISNRVAFLNEGFVKSDIEPTASFEYEPNAYYHIINKKSGNAVDVSTDVIDEGTKLMLWKPTKGKLTQHWKLEKDNNNNFIITNRVSEESIKAIGFAGANIVTHKIDNSVNFKWEIISTNSKDYFGIVGRSFGYVFNNSGGNLDNGTPLIEWNSDINRSDNAKFTFVKVGTNDLIKHKSRPLNVRYDAKNSNLHIISDNITNKKATVKIYTLSGTETISINQFNLNSSIDVSKLYNGVYIVKLIINNEVYSTKFIKQ